MSAMQIFGRSPILPKIQTQSRVFRSKILASVNHFFALGNRKKIDLSKNKRQNIEKKKKIVWNGNKII